jgi:hypothetical protein
MNDNVKSKFLITQDIFERNFFFWDTFTFSIKEDDTVTGYRKKVFGLSESTKTFKISDIDTVFFETKFRTWTAFIIWIPYTWILILIIKLYYKITVKDILYDKQLIIKTHNDLFTISVSMRSEAYFREVLQHIQKRKEEITNLNITPKPQTTSQENNFDFTKELEKLSELKKKGIISEEEFSAYKAKILQKI